MKDIIVHQVDISNDRLVDLTKLADQAKPFYDWVEKIAKLESGSAKSLNEIIFECDVDTLKQIISRCYYPTKDEKPFLFDGIGRVYPHKKSCFYFFAWMVRDAPQQRLSPLVTRMRKIEDVDTLTAQIDALAHLIAEYRYLIRTFSWETVREVIIDRLEGSRRSIKGHKIEALVRTAFITSFQNYFAIHNNYGVFKEVTIAPKQIQIRQHTIDVSVSLIPHDPNASSISIFVPIKSRETEGGGHAHIFSRDIMAAVTDISTEVPHSIIIVVIVAENWSVIELDNIADQLDKLFHFNKNPNRFSGFDDESQKQLNRLIGHVLDAYE